MKRREQPSKVALLLLFFMLFITACDQGPDPDYDPDRELTRKEAIDILIAQSGTITEPSIFTEEKVTREEKRRDEKGRQWSCKVKSINASTASNDFRLFSPNGDVIWVGNAIQGATVFEYTPSSIVALRGPGHVVIDNITGATVSSVELEQVTHNRVIDAANAIIRSQPKEFGADLKLFVQHVRSEEELAIALKANASFFKIVKADAGFKLTDKVERNSFLVSLVQPFYTLSFARPQRSSEFFHSTVTADSLVGSIGPGNSPVYVSSMTYGRVFYMLIEAEESVSDIEASLNVSVAGNGGGGKVKHFTKLNKVTVQVFAVGGGQDEVYDAITSGESSWAGFVDILREGNDITLAKPLSYQLRSIHSDVTVKNGIHFEYNVNDCSLDPVVKPPPPPNPAVCTGKALLGDVAGEERGTRTDIVCGKGRRIARIQVYYQPDYIIKGIKVFDDRGKLLGKSGGFNTYLSKSFSLREEEYLTKIKFEMGKWIDWVQFYTNERTGPRIGGPLDGSWITALLSAGEGKRISGIRVWSSKHDLEGIQLWTEKLPE